MSHPCPLCETDSPTSHATATYAFGSRTWLRCETCDLVFVQISDLPSIQEEKTEYLLHENSIDDSGYVSFLESFLDPLSRHLKPGGTGLDYGSGPAPVLAELLRRRGYAMATFDPIFAPDPSVLDACYDFVTSTEVFEHFHSPKADVERAISLLRPRGILGVMTSLRQPAEDFLSWYYIREQSHVSFYSQKTMAWIAKRWGLELLQCTGRITIFARSP